MIHIKKFIDRVSLLDSQTSRSLILSANDARMLRDELAKLLADIAVQKTESEVNVNVIGGKW